MRQKKRRRSDTTNSQPQVNEKNSFKNSIKLAEGRSEEGSVVEGSEL